MDGWVHTCWQGEVSGEAAGQGTPRAPTHERAIHPSSQTSPHLARPKPRISDSPLAHRVEDGPPRLVEGISHRCVAVDDPVAGRGKAVVVLEVVHACSKSRGNRVCKAGRQNRSILEGRPQ